MASCKILLLESIHPVAEKALGEAGFEVETRPKALQGTDLVEALKDVQVLGIRSKTQVTAAVLEQVPHLWAVGAFCIGTNQIDVDRANRVGIPVFNAPFSNTRSVAEMVMAEIVMLARQFGDRNRELHAGHWRKFAAGCHEVRGRVVGVIGYGHIGRQVGVLAEALGLRVIFHDIAARLPMGNNQACASMEEVLQQADFVTLHVPETEATKLMIGAAELGHMKPNACLINASRGTVVDIDALAEALRNQRLGGAAIDVFPEEPSVSDHEGFETPLRGLPNVILTPHIGGSTLEAQEAIGREVSTTLIEHLKTGATEGSVNFPEVQLGRPDKPGHRIINVHRNVPGVLSDINRIVSEQQANVLGQVLATHGDIGYLLMDVDKDVAHGIADEMRKLDTHLRSRVVS